VNRRVKRAVRLQLQLPTGSQTGNADSLNFELPFCWFSYGGAQLSNSFYVAKSGSLRPVARQFLAMVATQPAMVVWLFATQSSIPREAGA